MAKSDTLSLVDIRAAFRLIGECTELGADPYLWRARLFEGLCRLTGAVGAIGLETAGTFGKDDLRFLQFVYVGFDEALRRLHRRAVVIRGYETIDAPMIRFAQVHRTLTTRSHEQLITPREWRRSAMFNEYFRPSHLDDRLLTAARLPGSGVDGPTGEHGVSLYRATGERPFHERDRRLVHLVFEELRPLVGTKLETCQGRELRALSPRLRQVLDLLLLGYTDKEVAARCDLAQPTAREYITTIYRRYGASSRAHLLASFLRWRGDGPAK